MDDIQQGQVEGQGKEPVEMPATNKPVEVSAPPVEEARPAEATGELPKEVSERTRQEFEKLKAHNKEMAEKLKSLEKPPVQRRSALDIFAPQEQQAAIPQPMPFNQPFGPQTVVKQQVDEIKPVEPDENGYIDINTLNQTIAQVNERSRRVEEISKTAEQRALEAVDKVSKYEHTEKTLKTYAKHPYLDPNGDKFDEKFSDLVTKELLFRMYSGGSQDYLEAADAVKQKYYDPTTANTAQPSVDTDEKKETIAKRDQITTPTGGNKGNRQIDQGELVRASRSGDRNAVYQRLKQSGY